MGISSGNGRGGRPLLTPGGQPEMPGFGGAAQQDGGWADPRANSAARWGQPGAMIPQGPRASEMAWGKPGQGAPGQGWGASMLGFDKRPQPMQPPGLGSLMPYANAVKGTPLPPVMPMQPPGGMMVNPVGQQPQVDPAVLAMLQRYGR